MSSVNSIFVEQNYLLPNKQTSVMFQITNYCFVNNLDLSKGEIAALSIYYIYGFNDEADDMIITTNIFSSRQSLKNLKSKLNKLKIISKKDKIYEINNFMKIAVGDRIAIQIKAGNK